MAGGGGGAEGGGAPPRELDTTPTWAVASVCAVIIIVSILLEKVLHHIGEWFKERRKKALFEALEKVKAELMILGFISLLLTFGQSYIAQICIPEKAADTMLPCHLERDLQVEAEGGHRRRLLWDATMDSYPKHRFLGEASSVRCPEGKVSLISTNALHQLHIFIFFLAVFHVLTSAMTMILGRAKIRGWKEWEKETLSTDYEFSNDPARFRLTHEISFVRQHTSFWNRSPILFYTVSFFRQFLTSVRKADYLAMRHGFITVHLAPGSKFDFRKYIKRSLEDDFKVIVGISPVLWGSAVLFLLFNVKGWHTMFIISIMPLIIILGVGTKLQAIITRMAVEIQERNAVIQGIPLVQLSDHHFWFGRPQFVLFLLHFTLFQNAFELIYFLWICYEFGLNSCFHENNKVIVIRVCIGVGVQFVCSYVTLPLYALVSQMGSHMKKSIFDDQTSKALKKWHNQAVKKKNPQKNSPKHSPVTSPRASQNPAHRAMRSISLTPSGRKQYSDSDALGVEVEAPPLSSTSTISTVNNADLLTGSAEEHHSGKEDEYSFIKLSDP